MWIMSSEEFCDEAVQNKTGKNIGKRSIWFNGKKKNKETGITEEYVKPQWIKYVEKDFSPLPEFRLQKSQNSRVGCFCDSC